MKLERIKIEGYRSLKSVEWKPEPLNVLIGANASGKSNLLSALTLFPAAASSRLEQTILDGGGMVPLLWNGAANEIELDIQVGPEHPPIDYRLTLGRVARTGTYSISNEKCEQAGKVLVTREWAELADAIKPTETILSSRFDNEDHPEIRGLQTFLNSWSIYTGIRSDERSPVRGADVTRFETQLSPDGQNLIPVLHTLYTSNRDFEEMVDSAMLAAFPNDYEKLSFPSVPERGRISLGIRWKRSMWQPTNTELSDGTLRLLMLLAVLANPDPAHLIAIDEPETGLHPTMLPIVAELAIQAATKSQVLLSTHSPELLDAFPPDELPATTVFEWRDDHTEMRTVAGDDLKKWVEGYSLGRFAFSGQAETIL